MYERPGEGADPEAFTEREARASDGAREADEAREADGARGADEAREGPQDVVAARDLPVAPPSPPSPRVPMRPSLLARARLASRRYVLDRDPTFLSLLAPLLVVALVLFTRFPGTNYIFDEQEALLANPYVNASSGLRFIDAIHRDFWGLPADRSVGSYRPIPDMLWRALWSISKQPFFHHIYNVVFHAVNGAVLGRAVFLWTRRRGTAALAGLAFVACAVLTEAVSGIVGIADVLGGMGAVLAIAALSLPAWAMPSAVFAAVLFGLFCKESALVCVPLVPFAALVLAPLTHPTRPARLIRAALALLAAGGAFVLYVELRKRWFLSPLPQELAAALPADASRGKRLAHDFLVWFHQAPLPKDPLNNPLAEADTPHRVAGALRVYLRGLGQVFFPKTLSGDYSFPQEPVPDRLVSPESVGGAAMMILPPLVGVGMWIAAMARERRARRGEERAATAGPYREAEPLPESVDSIAVAWGQRLRVLGVGALVLAGAVVVVAGLLRKRPELFAGARLTRALAHALSYVEGRPLALAAVPLLMLGVGLILEGLRPLPRPDAPETPVPLRRAGLALGAVGLVWIVVSYFPHSNIPAVLPTVRAERFWYFPAIGSSLLIAALFSAAFEATRRKAAWLVPAVGAAFFLFQGVAAYRHAMDYRSDLDFWEATKHAVPRSAKAHLNYSVMKGARGDLNVRLEESRIAMELAPKWPMAHVYTGDVLCRMHRAEEAWPYYKEGFALGPNELSLIALALQCMHDENALTTHDAELRALADQHEGSWIAYLAIDTLNNHEKNKGVDPKYRPRGYNEGPKE